MTPRTALVTGAARGLGRAVAALLAEQGHRVVVGARDERAAGTTARAIGHDAQAVRLDVTDDASVAEALDRVGGVDILVNNAGVLLDGSTAEHEAAARTLAVNTLGSWRVSLAFLPGMVERGWGRVVMVSSGTASFTGGLHAGTPAYTVSKVALNALTVVLAERLRGTGVLVNAVNPGMVRTRMMPRATTSPEEAAPGVVSAATLPDDGPTGAFLRSGRGIPW
ncbi:SDR family NAD(P)-dependent oxidoreductase [Sphaerisporangium dianthi]|uniref:SDR family NAD(P)-dependent oxidoreductase n=1 Tax=Sphaerisporangium dianthi TaxID=1436120 RepID=A0ABV9CJP5_9ACTN